MTFRRSAPVALIGAIVVVVAVQSIVSNRLFSGLTDAVETSQFELMSSILDASLASAEGRALARAEMIADLPSTRRLLAARDRAGLLADQQLMFQMQKEKHGVDQMQFHIPPNISFLRLHDPATFGDDLTPFRPMVVAVQRDQMARKGFAIARSGPAIFGVVPIYDEANNFIGSFDVGIQFGAVLDNLKASYGLELAVFIDEQPLREFAKGISPDILAEQNRLGKYVKYHSTHWDLMQGLVTSSDLARGEGTFTREAQGLTYGVLLSPIRNGAGEQIGVIAVARDFSGSRAAASRSLVWQATIAIFAIVLLAGAVLVVIRGFLLRPLGILADRLGALVEGNAEPTAVEADSLCDELQDIAANTEKLRARLGSANEGADE